MANRNENTGLSRGIRLILQAAGTPLVVSEILDALPVRLEATNSTVSAICGKRAKAGEFSAALRGSKVEYGLNPDWQAPKSQLRGPRGSAATSAKDASPGGAEASPMPLAAGPAPVAGSTTQRAQVPHNLADRLAAILVDIEDALGDACDAQLPHELIKALVVANGAAHRAARLLGV